MVVQNFHLLLPPKFVRVMLPPKQREGKERNSTGGKGLGIGKEREDDSSWGGLFST